MGCSEPRTCNGVASRRIGAAGERATDGAVTA